MEYKVIATTYTRKKVQKQAAGWFEELKNLNKELNSYAKENWRVKQINSNMMDGGIVYTIVLERETPKQSQSDAS